jgi:hypothetical protein
VEDVMLKGHPLPQIRYAHNRMQNGMKPNHSKIQPNQVEAAVLFVLFYGELVQSCQRYLFPPTNLITPQKKFARFRQLS